MKRNLTAEQIAARDARRAKFKEMVKLVAGMTDEQRAHLTGNIGAVMTCEGRTLSLFNTCLLMTQCPEVSMVGGFRQWLAQGRCVAKGQHGHMIFIPKSIKASEAPADAMEATRDGADKADTRFIIGTVFDISQTVSIESTERVNALELEAA